MPVEKPERILDHHFLILWDAHVAEGEIAERSGRFAPYKKFPNTITACPPGIMPATRGSNKHEVIVGALNADFVEALEAEADTRPHGSFQTLRGTDDPDLRNLLLLLLKESETAGRCGGLYVDSLTTALGMRLLFASRLEKQPADWRCPLRVGNCARSVGSHHRAQVSGCKHRSCHSCHGKRLQQVAFLADVPNGDGTVAPSLSFGTAALRGSGSNRQPVDAAHRYRLGLRLLQPRSPHNSF